VEEAKVSEIKSGDMGSANKSAFLGDQFKSWAPEKSSNVNSPVQVRDFLVASTGVGKAASISQPPKIENVQRTEQMRPYLPGPAEVLGSQIKESLSDLLEWDIGSKKALKDYAQIESPASAMDVFSSDDEAEEKDEFGFRELTKALNNMNHAQKEHILALLDIVDKQGTMDLLTKTFKGVNSSFNKLISG
jgi:hypothetical protein